MEDIDNFQAETDLLSSNIEQIDRLLNLNEEHKEEVKKKGISKEGLQRQKKSVYMQTKGSDTCSICLKNIVKGDKIFELVCSHLFHSQCI
mmetsp:Transcript_32609/g.31830  ORF Transcript_32609/g.31830 Transcript_32609/m.31830 type:complete len:90 (+) Transcript_32609:214-483(+)